jgi:exodeoxyribonuclease-1
MAAIRRLAVYDFESTGLSRHFDQAIQFAGIAVDTDLNYIKGDELLLDIKLRPDVVPGPYAFALTGISLAQLEKNGMTEFEAAGHIQQWFKRKNTMITGFNTQGYDDEIFRNMLYRNQLEVYDHEWKDGNCRSDAMLLVMLVYALRPELLNWPTKADGSVSLKLEEIVKENGIEHTHAHDARSDVYATIELMRVIKRKDERLWSYFLTLSDKTKTTEMLQQRKPLIMVDYGIPRSLGNMSIVLPIIADLQNTKKMHCIDLRYDPTELLKLPPEEIRRRVFTKATELTEGEYLQGVRNLTTNQCPLMAPLGVLKGREDLLKRSALDMESCMKHAQMIEADPTFRDRLQKAMKSNFPTPPDIYQTLYSMKMIDYNEQALRTRQRVLNVPGPGNKALPAIIKTDPFKLAEQQPEGTPRLFELALRAKWSNYTDEVLALNSFTQPELQEWVDHLKRIWHGALFDEKNQTNLEKYKKDLLAVRAERVLTPAQEKALQEVEAYVPTMLSKIDTLQSMANDMAKAALEAEAAKAAAVEAEVESVVTTEPVAEVAEMATTGSAPIVREEESSPSFG